MSDAKLTTSAAAPASRRHTPRWLRFGIAIVFGLFYAYDIWEGIGNLVGLNQTAQGLDTQFSGFGLFVLLTGILLPILVYLLAAWLGRARGAGAQAALFLAGLCLNAAIAADIFMFGLGSLIA
ncbi:hypothetical protein E3T37_02215 [Cryobacterium sp. TMT2-10]|uniref:hypothetical protein n=1 Tax=unclassified Cryobacterium TaxID=2649013 RepID=UPI00106AD1F1|nr:MULTISPECIES: hypothetical protein [unclassified Cryobacterium]TFC88730.1 hypothetical protein E3T24_02440 [Cryobacterium sp. TmT2-59]TFD21039.1 hypothetical protein E3T32_07705 [Cryobacterium sp. TMT2-23]TFD42553.1 hypothetical protein E3T37_02215 [Cryobacterium sp. TMT2-10]